MGYTHYWEYNTNELDLQKWQRFMEDAREIICRSGVQICGPDGTGCLILNGDEVMFNGCDDDAHETFGVNRIPPSDGEFCKTVRLPYDLVVCAVLIAFKKRFGGKVNVGSDGYNEPDMWQPALDLYRRATGQNATSIWFTNQGQTLHIGGTKHKGRFTNPGYGCPR